MKVIRVIKSRLEFNKEEHRGGLRLRKMNEKYEYETPFYHIENSKLYLHKSLKTVGIAEKNDLIIIQELANEEEMKIPYANNIENFNFNNPKIIHLKHSLKAQSFEIFKLVEKDNEFELYLNYEGKSFFIGHPSRDNYKIANLKINQVVCFQINGKIVSTMSSRLETKYVEHNYTLEYIGEIDDIVSSEQEMLKKLFPPKYSKQVDERKILY